MAPSSKKADPEPRPKERDEPGKDDKAWDEVSEASWESFPASDPPAYPRRFPDDAKKDEDETKKTE